MSMPLVVDLPPSISFTQQGVLSGAGRWERSWW
jgi:hypothetical protein